MHKVDIAGLKIDAITKADLLRQLANRITNGQKTWVTTPYSEFLHACLMDTGLSDILNKADFAVPDGIGMFWAKKYLEIPLTAKSYPGKILQALWQIKYSLAAIIFYPKWIKSALPEKIEGSNLIWDLAKLAADNNFSIYLLGGFGNTPALVKQHLISQYPNILISAFSNKNPGDPTIIDDINKSAPDMLFVAFNPIKQEKWILENLPKLNIKFAIGLGGTFDYIAGKRLTPPKFLRKIGLEWLWRLLTQPKRYKRIFNATFGLAFRLWHYKVFMSLPFRPNVISVVLNKNNELLLALRNPKDKDLRATGDNDAVKFKNYWQFSQGGVDNKENLVETAKRELGEELQIKNVKFIKISNQKIHYFWKNGRRPFLFNKYHFKGQEQRIVYFQFTGNYNEIKVDKVEFIDFKWVPLYKLKEIIHSEKINLVPIVTDDLKETPEKAII